MGVKPLKSINRNEIALFHELSCGHYQRWRVLEGLSRFKECIIDREGNSPGSRQLSNIHQFVGALLQEFSLDTKGHRYMPQKVLVYFKILQYQGEG